MLHESHIYLIYHKNQPNVGSNIFQIHPFSRTKKNAVRFSHFPSPRCKGVQVGCDANVHHLGYVFDFFLCSPWKLLVGRRSGFLLDPKGNFSGTVQVSIGCWSGISITHYCSLAFSCYKTLPKTNIATEKFSMCSRKYIFEVDFPLSCHFSGGYLLVLYWEKVHDVSFLCGWNNADTL